MTGDFTICILRFEAGFVTWEFSTFNSWKSFWPNHFVSWCVSFKKCWLISCNTNKPIIWSCDKYKSTSSLSAIHAAAAFPNDKWHQFSLWSYLLVSASPPYLVRKAQTCSFMWWRLLSLTYITKKKMSRIRPSRKHAFPQIEVSKLDNRLLSVLSIFQLSAKSRIGKMFFSFWLFKQIVKKTTCFFIIIFFALVYFEKWVRLDVWYDWIK